MTLNESSLEKRFNAVSNSQGSIQSLSFFCLHYKNHHKKIAQIWLRCLQRAKITHRLTLIFLANDIVQNAKRKNTLSFIEDFKNILKETVPYLKDEKIKKSVERVFNIWQDRNIFDTKFTTELKDALNDGSVGGAKTPQATNNETANVKVEQGGRNITNDLISSLNRLEDIEKNGEKFKSSEDCIVDRLTQGTFTLSEEGNNGQPLAELRNYIIQLKIEIDERNKLARLLEDSMNNQKRLVKESEEQLIMYKSQLEYVSNLREDLRSPE